MSYEYGFNTTIVYAYSDDIELGDATGIGRLHGVRKPYDIRSKVFSDDVTELAIVPHASISRMEDSVIDESNYRSLVRDYPWAFVEVSYTYQDELVVPTWILDHDDDLRDIIVALSDTSIVYDDSDHSELESEKQEETWEAYVHSDLLRALDRKWHMLLENDLPVYDAVDEFINEMDDEGKLKEWFFEAVSEDDGFGQFNDHCEWESWKDLEAAFIEKVKTAFENR